MSQENIGPCDCCGTTTTGTAEGCQGCRIGEDGHVIEINAPCLGLVNHTPGHVCANPPPGDADHWIVSGVTSACGGIDFLQFTIWCEGGRYFLAWEIIKDAVTCDFGTVEGTVNSDDPLDVDFSFSPNGACCPCGDNTIEVSLTE